MAFVPGTFLKKDAGKPFNYRRMCYHVKIHHPAHQIAESIDVALLDSAQFGPREQISGFQHPFLPIWHEPNGKGIIRTMSWGIWPSWSPQRDFRMQTLNARIETVHEKPAFKEAWRHRGVLPVFGFYEWQWLDAKGKKKASYLLEQENASLFFLAAILQSPHPRWPCFGFSLLTLPAEGCMKKIHNHGLRMPYILDFEGAKQWIQGKQPQANPSLLTPKRVDKLAFPELSFNE